MPFPRPRPIYGLYQNVSLIPRKIHRKVEMKEKQFSKAEVDFAAQCIAINRRADGRHPKEPRHVNVSLGPSWGFAEVSFGDSLAIASTSVEPIVPSSDRPNEGLISINIEQSPAASEFSARNSLHRSQPSRSFTETRNCVESFIRDSRAIDTEALCILAGIKVWSVRVNVDLLNDDGNTFDVVMMAVMASLQHARRPEVTVSGKEVRIHTEDEREPVQLPVHHIPLSATFALFGAGKPYESDSIAIDPTGIEEAASAGMMSLAFNVQGEVCGVYKAGGLPLRQESFVQCVEMGSNRVIELTAILKSAMDTAATDHPISTQRPMLAHPEPSAQLRRKFGDINRDEEEEKPGAMWNAVPMEDVPPPMQDNMNTVEMGYKDTTINDVTKAIFESRDGDMKPMIVEKSKHLMESNGDEADSSEDQSSDDDLESAILAQPKKGKRRR